MSFVRNSFGDLFAVSFSQLLHTSSIASVLSLVGSTTRPVLIRLMAPSFSSPGGIPATELLINSAISPVVRMGLRGSSRIFRFVRLQGMRPEAEHHRTMRSPVQRHRAMLPEAVRWRGMLPEAVRQQGMLPEAGHYRGMRPEAGRDREKRPEAQSRTRLPETDAPRLDQRGAGRHLRGRCN